MKDQIVNHVSSLCPEGVISALLDCVQRKGACDPVDNERAFFLLGHLFKDMGVPFDSVEYAFGMTFESEVRRLFAWLEWARMHHTPNPRSVHVFHRHERAYLGCES